MHGAHASQELMALKSAAAELLAQARTSALHPSAIAVHEEYSAMVNAAYARARIATGRVEARESLTTHELAAAWRKSAWTIRDYAKNGRVPGARKVGRDWLFPADPVLLPPSEPSDTEGDDLLEHLESCLKAV